MIEPIWTRENLVYAVHRRQLAVHGGAQEVRDQNLLLSALARPHNLLAYSEEEPDLAALSASYAYGIARNHPLVDGNKRVALVICRPLLVLNGHDLIASQQEKVIIFLRLAEGSLSAVELAAWIRERLQKAP